MIRIAPTEFAWLVVATALTVLGIGTADNAVANFDATSWLWSSTRCA